MAVTVTCSAFVGNLSLGTVAVKLPSPSVVVVTSGVPSPSTSISTLVLGSALPTTSNPPSVLGVTVIVTSSGVSDVPLPLLPLLFCG